MIRPRSWKARSLALAAAALVGGLSCSLLLARPLLANGPSPSQQLAARDQLRRDLRGLLRTRRGGDLDGDAVRHVQLRRLGRLRHDVGRDLHRDGEQEPADHGGVRSEDLPPDGPEVAELPLEIDDDDSHLDPNDQRC